jgi:hypothetical protein
LNHLIRNAVSLLLIPIARHAHRELRLNIHSLRLFRTTRATTTTRARRLAFHVSHIAWHIDRLYRDRGRSSLMAVVTQFSPISGYCGEVVHVT